MTKITTLNVKLVVFIWLLAFLFCTLMPSNFSCLYVIKPHPDV